MNSYTQTDYLLEHDKRLNSRIVSAKNALQRFNVFAKIPSKALNTKRLENDYNFLLEINKILSKIMEIARKPHFMVKEQDIIVRSSLISEFDNERFKQTLRESDLWRRKSGVLVPEQAHSAENIDNFATYENIVVKMCFNQIEVIVNKLSDYYHNYISDLKTSFSFDNYSFTSLFNNDAHQLIDKNLFKVHSDVNQILNRLHIIYRKIQLIHETYFFKQLQNVPLIRDKVVSTNILKFNRKYSHVFRFYLLLIKNQNNEIIEDALISYYTRLVLHSLSQTYKPLKTKQVFDHKLMNLKFSNKKFFLNVLRIRKNTILFKVKANTRRSISAFSSLTIVTDLEKYRPVNEVTAYEYVVYEEKLYRYTEKEFVLLKHNYSQGELGLISMLLASLSTNIEIDQTYKIGTCPICGKSDVNISKGNDIHCLSCGASHAIINFKSKHPYLWIKNVKLEQKQ